ncbi:hypothetical protein FNV43_RR23746 [Rhamnella rubrinervis]|uniref:Uncharacterized protein n=1 Tax=Rhamnella rubrinervis TaxID=2594499 RepID=A0A8K0DQY0_9ROSA|nr:hypothetical protein FNV43_RR23746 [Rhamnella rubrinervis]
MFVSTGPEYGGEIFYIKTASRWETHSGANCEEERQRQLGWVLDWIRMEKEKREIEIGKVCKRCKQIYSPRSNTPSSCRFHPSFFVCRRHDDQKRYYELGPDDPPYPAKFYDCCGAEDPEASGCTTSFHVSYDDD